MHYQSQCIQRATAITSGATVVPARTRAMQRQVLVSLAQKYRRRYFQQLSAASALISDSLFLLPHWWQNYLQVTKLSSRLHQNAPVPHHILWFSSTARRAPSSTLTPINASNSFDPPDMTAQPMLCFRSQFTVAGGGFIAFNSPHPTRCNGTSVVGAGHKPTAATG